MRSGVRFLSASVKRGFSSGQKIAARFRAGGWQSRSPNSAISATVRPQPVQTLTLAPSAQISLQGDSGRSVIDHHKHDIVHLSIPDSTHALWSTLYR